MCAGYGCLRLLASPEGEREQKVSGSHSSRQGGVGICVGICVGVTVGVPPPSASFCFLVNELIPAASDRNPTLYF